MQARGLVNDPDDDRSEAQRRCVARLARDRGALRALRDLGVDDEAIDRHAIGLATELTDARTGLLLRRALRFPIMAPDGSARALYGNLSLPGVTTAEQARGPANRPIPPETCWSRPFRKDLHAMVVPGPLAMWREAAAAAPDLVVLCPSHEAGIPVEWRANRFWRQFSSLTLSDDLPGDLLKALEPFAAVGGRPPPGATFGVDAGPSGGLRPARADDRYARDGVPVAPVQAVSTSLIARPSEDHADCASPIDLPASLAGVVVGGLCHHPRRVESSRPGWAGAEPARIHRYETVVLRSDGETLRFVTLPFPPGTPPHHRVHVLSDGTRVSSRAAGAVISTWSERGVQRFVSDVRARRAVCRSVAAMVADVERSLRSSVWLPCEHAYALVAVFVLATHVHRAFPAMPIMLACGPPGSGKSELARAVAGIGFNAVLLGQATAAGVARTAEQSGGLIVLDDCEALGGAGVGSADLQHALRVGYKAATARKAVVEHTGEVRMADLYGPRMVANTSGASAALVSRSVIIATQPAPACFFDGRRIDDVPDPVALRDELHAWGMMATAALTVECGRAISERPPRDRAEEVALPLLIAARLAGGDVETRVSAALQAAGDLPALQSAEATFELALAELSSTGVGSEVSMIQIAMEVALANRGELPTGALASPEWIGARLVEAGFRDVGAPVSRRRLFGQITRIYPVLAGWRRQAADGETTIIDAFAFCTATRCGDCRYSRVCPLVAPKLRQGRARAGVPV